MKRDLARRMDATPFIDRILDDEGITGGLKDAEAKVLVDWLIASLKQRIRAVSDESKAEEISRTLRRRARRIAKITELLCEQHDTHSASEIWKESGSKHSLDELELRDPTGVVKRLIQWETEHDV